jgi:tetratricopeptide (TPR) repeat protein
MIRQIAVAGFLVALLAGACSGLLEAISHNNIGRELIDEGRWEEALAELDMAMELDPELAEAYNNRGSTYSYLEQYEQTKADLDKAIKLDPNNAVV